MKETAELTEEEADWIASLLSTLDALGIDRDPTSLDAYLMGSRDVGGGTAATPVVQLVAAGLGDLLNRRLGLRWVSVTDSRGSRLALFGDVKRTLVFPMDAVARRLAGEPGSLARYVAETTATIEQIRARLAG